MIATTLARRALFAALAFACIAGPVRAQQPPASAIAAAKEYLEIKGAHAMFDPLVVGIVETAKNNFLPTHPNLVKELNEVAAQLRTEFAPRAAEVINDFATLYAQRFTEQELKEAIAFYKSPVGKKFLSVEPGVIDQGLLRAQDWSRKLSEEIIARYRAEMKKKGHDL